MCVSAPLSQPRTHRKAACESRPAPTKSATRCRKRSALPPAESPRSSLSSAALSRSTPRMTLASTTWPRTACGNAACASGECGRTLVFSRFNCKPASGQIPATSSKRSAALPGEMRM
eukprot:12857368-Alexandrium_andersonii.AAC.1